MASRQTGAIDAFTRNFATGYELGKDIDQRNAARELANTSYTDDKYAITPDAASSQTPVNRYRTDGGAIIPANQVDVLGKRPEDAGEMVTEQDVEFAYGEGGEARNIEELLNADKATGVLDDADPQYGVNALDRAAQGYQKVPKAKVLDWEAYKKDRADAYARAGMHEKAANIDTEVDELKRRKFLEYTSRAIQVWDQDPARAAEFLTMANQFNADGTNSVYVPNPNGQSIMEVDFDEMTHKPLGQGSPIDKRVIQEIAMQYADPVKYGYYQLDREWAGQVHKDRMDQYNRQMDKDWDKHRENLAARYKGLEVNMAMAEMRSLTALQEAALRNGDTNAEGLGKFKNKVFDYLTSTEKGFLALGAAGLSEAIKEQTIGALAAGAGDWYITNGEGVGAAEAIRAQDLIMAAPLDKLKANVNQEEGILHDPDTGIKLRIPPSAMALYRARLKNSGNK